MANACHKPDLRLRYVADTFVLCEYGTENLDQFRMWVVGISL